MTKFVVAIAVASLTVASAAPAFAGWDRSRAFDPAFSHSADRQIELAAGRLNGTAASGTAVATNDAGQGTLFVGARVERAVEGIDSHVGD